MFSFSYNYVFHSTPFFPNTNSERIRFKVLSKMVKEEMKIILLFFKYFCYNLLLKDMPVLILCFIKPFEAPQRSVKIKI